MVSFSQLLTNKESIGTTIGNVALFLALAATVIAIVCYLPGAIRVIKTKDTRSLSLLMYWLTGIGCIVWIVVGILYLASSFLTLKEDPSTKDYLLAINAGVPVIISNLSLGTCCFILIFMKHHNRRIAASKKQTEEVYVSELVKQVSKKRLAKLQPKFAKFKNKPAWMQWLFKKMLMDDDIAAAFEIAIGSKK